MPTIEVTAEQARALARGEDITIAAPNPRIGKTYVVVLDDGRIWRYTVKSADRYSHGTIYRGPGVEVTRAGAAIHKNGTDSFDSVQFYLDDPKEHQTVIEVTH